MVEHDVQFIDVGMEYPVDKADARALVGILIGEFDTDFPETAGKGSLIRSLEPDIEFLHIVVDQGDFVVAHQHLHDLDREKLESALVHSS